MASSDLNALLFIIRQHPAFEELKRAVEAPRMPRFRPSRADTLETMGAKSVFASGQIEQQERWLALLTGKVPPQEEANPSQQEKS